MQLIDENSTKLKIVVFSNSTIATFNANQSTVIKLDDKIRPSDIVTQIGFIPIIPGNYDWSNNNASIVPYGWAWAAKSTGSSEYILAIHYWNSSTKNLTSGVGELKCFYFYIARTGI